MIAPRGTSVRPTSDRVREAVFSSLGERVVGATVLDLFAGTGSLGLEAASRGAGSVTFVENAPHALTVLQQNLEMFRRGREIASEWAVVQADAVGYVNELVSAGRKFSLIFADPPYGVVAQVLLNNPDLPRITEPGGRFVLESSKRDVLTPPAVWTLTREAVYGDTRVSVFAVA